MSPQSLIYRESSNRPLFFGGGLYLEESPHMALGTPFLPPWTAPGRYVCVSPVPMSITCPVPMAPPPHPEQGPQSGANAPCLTYPEQLAALFIESRIAGASVFDMAAFHALALSVPRRTGRWSHTGAAEWLVPLPCFSILPHFVAFRRTTPIQNHRGTHFLMSWPSTRPSS